MSDFKMKKTLIASEKGYAHDTAVSKMRSSRINRDRMTCLYRPPKASSPTEAACITS
jgi:hypothetical protein